jgi:hypothetical protein
VNVNPWELNPVLAQDRLVVLARAAVTTRNRAFAEADRDAGDTNWGLACKAHERTMHVLGRLAAGGEHPWLTVIRDGLYVMPLIDDVPVRVFRGSADRPSARHLDALRLEHERAQPARPQMAFDFMGGVESDEGGPWYWLMAMETDEAGMVSRVVFFQANDAGETRYPWACPLPVEEPAASTVETLALFAETPTLLADVAAPIAAAPAPAPIVEAPAPVPIVEAPAPIVEAAAPIVEALSLFAEVAAPIVEAPLPGTEPSPKPTARGRGRRVREEPRQAELWEVVAAE